MRHCESEGGRERGGERGREREGEEGEGREGEGREEEERALLQRMINGLCRLSSMTQCSTLFKPHTPQTL